MGDYEISRSTEEIDAVLNAAHENQDTGNNPYPGMSYSDGVADGIEWACGMGDNEPPLP